MWETLKDLGLLLAGAVISLVSVWIESKRTRKWALEDRKFERAIAARDIRLKEGEEMIKISSRQVFYFAQAMFKLIEIQNFSQIGEASKIIDDYHNSWEESDKGKIIYEASIKSLDDKQLASAWDKVESAFVSYSNYCVSLSQFVNREGIEPFKKLHDKNREEEKEQRNLFYYAVSDFYRRINELRSQ